MKENVVYHNPDVMGYLASEVTTLRIVTRKHVSNEAIGSRVWLITGERRPRTFYLRG